MTTTFKQFLIEGRKNKEQNPKVSINQEIEDALEKTDKTIPGSQIKNCFVSFTEIEKLGINPKSKHETPLGIYAYPAEYVHRASSYGKKSMDNSVPFAGDSEFANIFSAKGNIVDVPAMSTTDMNEYYEKMKKYWHDIVGGSYEDASSEVGRLIDRSEYHSNHSDSAGGRFWFVTMELAEFISDHLQQKRTVSWNKLFRAIGIDGCVDNGAGIIHTNEPTQAVFFSKSVIQNNKRVQNKYSPDRVSLAKSKTELYKTAKYDLDRMTPYGFFQKYVEDGGLLSNINDLNQVIKNPHTIKKFIYAIPGYYPNYITTKNMTPEIIKYAIFKEPSRLNNSYMFMTHKLFAEIIGVLYNKLSIPEMQQLILGGKWRISGEASMDTNEIISLILLKYPDIIPSQWIKDHSTIPNRWKWNANINKLYEIK
jgi:hypothetical protein